VEDISNTREEIEKSEADRLRVCLYDEAARIYATLAARRDGGTGLASFEM